MCFGALLTLQSPEVFAGLRMVPVGLPQEVAPVHRQQVIIGFAMQRVQVLAQVRMFQFGQILQHVCQAPLVQLKIFLLRCNFSGRAGEPQDAAALALAQHHLGP